MRSLLLLPILALASCEEPKVVAYESDPTDEGTKSPVPAIEGQTSPPSAELDKVVSAKPGSAPSPVPSGSIEKRDKTDRIIPSPTPRPITPADPNAESDPETPQKTRTAVAVPGKPGFVFNPWTNGVVDVRGLPPGTLARDPQDSDPEHIFRVP